MKAFLFSALIAVSGIAFGHEGHNEAPGTIKAFHGGTIKSGKELNLELLTSGGELKVFPLAHGGVEIPLSEVKLSGTAQVPKGKAFPLTFIEKEGSFYTKLDFKGAYRLSIDLKALYKGKTDSIKIQAEQ